MKGLITIALILAFSESAHANSLEWANGYWGVNPKDLSSHESNERTCDANPVEINIDAKNSLYESRIGTDESRTAVISNVTPNAFTIRYHGEKRVMEDGRKHVWTIKFIDEDTFYWVREDWKSLGPNHRTPLRYRCENNLTS